MNEVIRILMHRDGLSKEEATKVFSDTLKEIHDSSLEYDEVEEIIACNLGIEMDYIFDFL